MFGRSNTFDRALDRATSQLLLDPDWDSTLQICDCIRQLDVQPKYAISAIKRKISAENNHIALFALQVLEAIMKNCGTIIHNEVATKEFMEFFKDQTNRRPDAIKDKILEMIQIWATAFKDQSNYRIVVDTYDLLKMEGHTFPSINVSEAMFSSEAAPAWKDGPKCITCKVSFGTFIRKHHCRACGDIYCQKCSAKQAIIPKFGIEKEVRVCDNCFDKLSKKSDAKNAKEEAEDDDALPEEYLKSSLAKQSQVPEKKTDQELQEEEELQLALALSQSEEEEKAKQRAQTKASYGVASHKAIEAKQALKSQHTIDTSDMDPELARYLNRNYWEEREQKQTPISISPSPSTIPQPSAPSFHNMEITPQPVNFEQDAGETEFLSALAGSIQIFMNRMRSDSERGRSVAIDTSVQTLFNTISAMHPRLIASISNCEESRARYEQLQDKISQLMDAREALNMLRHQHDERRAAIQAAEDVRRQQEMATTLGNLRQKKQEYLQFQHQMAVNRMRAQETEMAKRLEHQKHMQRVRAMQYTSGAISAPNSQSGAPQYGASYSQPPSGYPPQMPSYQGQYQGQDIQAYNIGNDQLPAYNANNEMPAYNNDLPPYNPQASQQLYNSSPQHMQPPQQMQAPPPHHMQAPPPHHMQAPPPQHMQAPPPQHMQAPPPQHMQAPPPQHMQAPPPQQMQAPPPQQMQAPPSQQFQAPPSQQFQAPPSQQFQAPPSQQFQVPAPQQFQAPAPQQFQAPPTQKIQTSANQQFQAPSHQQFQAPPPHQMTAPVSQMMNSNYSVGVPQSEMDTTVKNIENGMRNEVSQSVYSTETVIHRSSVVPLPNQPDANNPPQMYQQQTNQQPTTAGTAPPSDSNKDEITTTMLISFD